MRIDWLNHLEYITLQVLPLDIFKSSKRSSPNLGFFQKKLYNLINTVRSTPNEPVTVKGAGSNRGKEDLQEIRNNIKNLLQNKGIKLNPEHLLLGGKNYRITEFYPLTGRLVTYFSDSEEKIIL